MIVSLTPAQINAIKAAQDDTSIEVSASAGTAIFHGMDEDAALDALVAMRTRAVGAWGKGHEKVVALDQVAVKIAQVDVLDQEQARQERAHNEFLNRNNH